MGTAGHHQVTPAARSVLQDDHIDGLAHLRLDALGSQLAQVEDALLLAPEITQHPCRAYGDDFRTHFVTDLERPVLFGRGLCAFGALAALGSARRRVPLRALRTGSFRTAPLSTALLALPLALGGATGPRLWHRRMNRVADVIPRLFTFGISRGGQVW